MANSAVINVGANATGVYSEIVRQARRAEEVIKRTPLRLEVKNFGAIRGFTADIDRFDKSLTRMSAVIQTFGQSAAILFGVQRAMASLVTSTVDVEKRMTALNVVFGETSSNLKKFGGDLFDIAKQTGQSFATVTDVAQEFARQGLGISETAKRTRDAMILIRTTGLDAGAAVEDLTATLNTFKKEALDSTKVINTFRNVDTAFAVSSADLAEGIKRAGAAAQDAKIDFNQLVSLITALQQTTARGGSNIGNSLKSIATRLQRSSVKEALEGIGVASENLDGTYRGAIPVLTDLAKALETVSDAQRAQIKETVAGAYQVNALSAILQDLSGKYSVYSQALETAKNTQNEAIASNEQLNKTTDSLVKEALTNLTQLSKAIGSVSIEPTIKSILNSFNGLFERLNNLGEDSLGAKIGSGILNGLANFIGGPGLAVIAAGFLKISRLVFKGSIDQFKSVLTLGKENENILQNQQRVSAVLNSQDPIIRRLIDGARTREELEKAVFGQIEKQTQALIYQQNLERSLATSFTRTTPRRFASGYIPEMSSEKSMIQKGVGGAPSSARPVVIPNFNLGKGKRETIIANSSEYVVPNFAGSGGSAIFNQDMVKKYGLPSGAKKIMANGYVPNLAQFKYRTNNQLDFLNSLKPYSANIKDALFLSELVGGKVNDIRVTGRINKEFGGVLGTQSGGNLFGFFNPATNNISVNQYAQKGLGGANSLIHEIGHAGLAGLTRASFSSQTGAKIFDNLRRAYDSSRASGNKAGSNFGLNLSGYPKNQYFEENVVQAFAENLLRSRTLGKDIRKDTLYRYVRKLAGKGLGLFANGYVPNLARPLTASQKAGREIARRLAINDPYLNIEQAVERASGLKRYSNFGGAPNTDLSFSSFIKKIAEKKGFSLRTYRGSEVGFAEKSFRVGDKDLKAAFFIKKGDNTSADFSFESGESFSRTGLNKPFETFGKVLNIGADFSKILNLAYKRGEISQPIIEFVGADKKLDKLYRKAFGGTTDEHGYTKVSTDDFIKFAQRRGAANGYIPNLAVNPLSASISREVSALTTLGYNRNAAINSVRVGVSPSLQSNINPSGLGVYNTLQGQTSIGKAIADHSGQNVKRAGFIPNLAPNLPSVPVNAKFFGNIGLQTNLGRNLPDFNLAKFASLDSLSKYIKTLTASVSEIDRNRSKFTNSEQIIKEYNKRVALAVKEVERRSFAGNPRATLIKGNLQKRYDESLNIQRKPQAERNFLIQQAEQERLDKIEKNREKRRDGLFAASFVIPFAASALTEASGEKGKKKEILNNLGSDISLATTLPLLLGAGKGGIALSGIFGAAKIFEARKRYSFEDKFKTSDLATGLENSKNKFSSDIENVQKFQQLFVSLQDAKVEGNISAISTLIKQIAEIPGDLNSAELKDALKKAISSPNPEKAQQELASTFTNIQKRENRSQLRQQTELDILNKADENRSGFFNTITNFNDTKGIKLNKSEQEILAESIVNSIDFSKLSKSQIKNLKNANGLSGVLGSLGADNYIKRFNEAGQFSPSTFPQKAANTTLATLLLGPFAFNTKLGKEIRELGTQADSTSDDLSKLIKKFAEQRLENQKDADQLIKSSQIGESVIIKAQNLSRAFSRLLATREAQRNFGFESSISAAERANQQETSPTLQILNESNINRGRVLQGASQQVSNLFAGTSQFILDEFQKQAGAKGKNGSIGEFINSGAQNGDFNSLIKTIREIKVDKEGTKELQKIGDTLEDIQQNTQNQLRLLDEQTRDLLKANSLASGKNLLNNLGNPEIFNKFRGAFSSVLSNPTQTDIKKASERLNSATINNFSRDSQESAFLNRKNLDVTKSQNVISFFENRKALGLEEDFNAQKAAAARIKNEDQRKAAFEDIYKRIDSRANALVPDFLNVNKSRISNAGQSLLGDLSTFVDQNPNLRYGQSRNIPKEIQQAFSLEKFSSLPSLFQELRNSAESSFRGGRSTNLERQDSLDRINQFEKQFNELTQQFNPDRLAEISKSQANDLVGGGGGDNAQLTQLITTSESQLDVLKSIASNSEANFRLQAGNAIASFARERVGYAQSVGASGELAPIISKTEKQSLIDSANQFVSNATGGTVKLDTKDFEKLVNDLNIKVSNAIEAKIDVNTNTGKEQSDLIEELRKVISAAIEDYHRKNNKNPQVK